MRRMALRGLVFALGIAPALMAADAARKLPPPLPKPKPAEIMRPGTEAPAEIAAPEPEAPEMAAPEPEASEAGPDAAGPSAIVIPREKPGRLQEPASTPDETVIPDSGGGEKTEPDGSGASAIVIPRAKPVEPKAAPEEDDEKPNPGEDFAICRKELAELGATFTVPDMPAASGKCKVVNPVRISAITSPAGKVDFPGEPILNCIFAKQFTSWVSDIAGPVVKARTGEALVAISTGPGYECRGRNGDGSGKISEHALGNAVDIASFRLASKESMPVANVAKTGNVESRWLMALRISACGYFTTVLGPGSNAAHAEHYHFDLGLHGKSGNYKICE
ncbi:MAG: extensin family protein [Parvibaculaceae bacterium]